MTAVPLTPFYCPMQPRFLVAGKVQSVISVAYAESDAAWPPGPQSDLLIESGLDSPCFRDWNAPLLEDMAQRSLGFASVSGRDLGKDHL